MIVRRLILVLRLARQPLYFLLIVLPVSVLLGVLLRGQASTLRMLGMAGVGLYLLPSVPIVLCSITLAFDRMVSEARDRGYVLRLALVTTAIAIAVAVLGLVSAMIWHAGSLNDSAKLAVGGLVEQGSSEIRIYLRSQPHQASPEPLLKMLLSWIVPNNIIQHLGRNETLKIIVASAGFGLTIHLIPSQMAASVRLLLSSLNAMASRLLQALLDASPLIILLLVASAVGTANLGVMLALLSFTASIVSAAVVCLLIAAALTRRYRTRSTSAAVLVSGTAGGADAIEDEASNSLDVFLLGLSTASSIALYSSITHLLRRWCFSEQQIDTAIAINLLVARAGNIVYNMAAIVFAINFYQIPLTFSLLLRSVLLAILTGLATAGLSGIAVVPVVALALDTLRIPSGPLILLLLSIDPLLGMVRAGITGVVSLAGATLICSVATASDAAATVEAAECQV
jgi:proton glutamate symport protein